MLNKNRKGMGILLLASMLLVGCGDATTGDDNTGSEQVTQQDSERFEAYLEQQGEKTEEDYIAEFRGQLEALSKFYQGGFNYLFYTVANKDVEVDDSMKLMYETFGTEVDDKYYVPVSQLNLLYDGERVQIEDKTLPQGNVYVMSKHVYDGTYVYEEVDRLLTFARDLVDENPLVNDIRGVLFEDGLADRLAKFEDKYKDYWLRSETNTYTQPIDSIRAYFGGLYTLSNDENTVVDSEQHIVKLTLTQEQVNELNEQQLSTYPIFLETYTEDGDEDLVYELHYNYQDMTFKAYRIAPEGSNKNSYFAELFPVGFEGVVEVPEEKATLIETENFYDEYTNMLGIKDEYLEQETEASTSVPTEDEDPEGYTVAEEPVQVTGD